MIKKKKMVSLKKKIKLQGKLVPRKGEAKTWEEKWNNKVKQRQGWDYFCLTSFLVHFSVGLSSCHSCMRSYNRNNQI